MKNVKRVLSLLLSLIIVIGICPNIVFSEDAQTGEVITEEVSSIAVKTAPNKVNYYYNDTLDTTGLVLSVSYLDGTVKDVNSGFTCDKSILTTTGNQNVTVTYAGKNTSFHIMVNIHFSATAVGENSHRYSACDTLVTWKQAKAMCEGLGGHLVTILDSTEQTLASSVAEKGTASIYHIGLTDAETEGTFKWITGEPFSYSHWSTNQPDDAGGCEDWCEMYTSRYDSSLSGGWNDDSDAKLRGFICEFDSQYVPLKTIIKDNHMYSIFNVSMSWTNAKKTCENLGGHLVTITDADENNAVTELVSYGVGTAYWIGASDAEVEGTWKWVTGENFSYSAWETGEPSNTLSREHYATIYSYYSGETYTPGRWNDMPDNITQYGFICEIELDDMKPIATAEYGSSYYELYNKSMCWEDAEAYAESKNGHLAIIDDENENTFISGMLDNSDYTYGGCYIGITDKESEGTWETVTGEPVSYFNWNTGEPNNGIASGPQNYAQIYSKNGTAAANWDDCYANNNVGFMIEYDGASVYYDLNHDNISPNYIVVPSEKEGWITNSNGTVSATSAGLTITYDDKTDLFCLDGENSNNNKPGFNFPQSKHLQSNYVSLSSMKSSGEYTISDNTDIVFSVNKSNYMSTQKGYDNVSILHESSNTIIDDNFINPNTSSTLCIRGLVRTVFHYSFSCSFSEYKFKLSASVDSKGEGSSVISPIGKRIPCSRPYGELKTPEREGYEFIGWFTAPNGGKQITTDSVKTDTSEQILYAHWKSNEYTITYDAKGGDCDISSKSICYDELIDSPVPTRDGYTFLGWYTNKNGGEALKNGVKYKYPHDVILYACWVDNNRLKCGENVTWTLDGNSLIISGFGNMYDYHADEAPWNILKNYVKNIEISDGVKSIGNYAFADMACLSVNMPDSITQIGEGAFFSDLNLTAIIISSNVSIIKSATFFNCISLKVLEFGSNILTIDEEAFDNCNGLQKLIIDNPECKLPDSWIVSSDTVTIYGFENSTAETFANNNENQFSSIGFYEKIGSTLVLFTSTSGKLEIKGAGELPDYESNRAPWNNYATQIKKVEFGEGITYIGDNTLSGCTNVTDVTLPNSLKNLGENVFEDTSWFKKMDSDIVMIKSILYSCEGSFDDNKVVLNAGITGVSRNVSRIFTEKQQSPESIQISNTVSDIKEGSLSYAYNLTELTVHPGNASYKAVNNILYSKDGKVLLCCPAGMSGNISIPDSVTEIADYAFAGCKNLMEITIGKNVETIGENAFDETKLSTIHGYDGSFAQEYALKNGYTFEAHVSTVTYDCNDGIDTTVDVPVNTGCSIGSLYVPGREGYDFSGWYIETDDEDVLLTSDYIVNDDVTVYAHWTEIVEEEPYLTGIEVSEQPSRLSYYTGDTFSSEGMELKAVYSDGTEQTITSGYSCTPVKLNTNGTQPITVMYAGLSTTLNVSVSDIAPVSLSLISMPKTLTYYVTPEDSETNPFSSKGLVGVVEYSNGTRRIIKDTSVFEYMYDFTKASDKANVTVIYSEKDVSVSAFYQVKVLDRPVIYSQEITAVSGDEIAVPIYISGNTGLMGAVWELNYDASVLQPETLTKGTVKGDIGWDKGYGQDGTLKVFWYDSEEYTDNGMLFIAYFKVNTNAETGTTEIGVSYSEDDTFDGNYENVQFECSNAAIGITKVEVPALYSDNIQTTPGSYVDIPVKCKNNAGIADMSFVTLKYDPSVFTYESTTAGLASIFKTTGQSGTIKVTLNEYSATNEDGTLFTVRMKIADSYTGTKDISIETDDTNWKSDSVSVEVTADSVSTLIYADDSALNAGESIIVPVKIQNNQGIMGYYLVLTYEQESLNVKSITTGSAWTGGSLDYKVNEDGTVNIVWSGSDNVTADGEMFAVELEAKAGVQSKDIEIGISYTEDETYNSEWENEKLECRPMQVSISAFEYGDVNGDGIVNGRDIIRLRKYLATYDEKTGKADAEIFAGADANGDGTVNGRDLIRLRKYIANYDDDTHSSSVILGA